MQHIGVYGGKFNPPHIGHLLVPQAALDQFGLMKVIFVPSGRTVHKRTDVLDHELRYEMIAAATADNPDFEVSRTEIDRPGDSWTIDTLKEFQLLYGPGVRLNFIIGEDNIYSFQGYDRRAELLSLCRLLVAPRQTIDPQKMEEWRRILPEADIGIIHSPSNEISSSLVRTVIRKGESVRYLVHPAVYNILIDKGHYNTIPSAPAVVPSPGPPAQAGT